MAVYKHGSENPENLVVLLHGYGSNGEDLISLAPEWEEFLPGTLFLSPDAPNPCEMGFGYQWFSLQNWLPAAMLQGAESAALWLNNFLDEMLQTYDLSLDRLALVGFSQGTMMSLYTAPRRPQPVAGVLGYSGALLGGENLIGNMGAVKMPVHLIHGDFDTVVPVAAYHHAMQTLSNAGYDVTGSVSPGLPHSIDHRGIDEGGSFLRRVLKIVQES